jgi:uncharacterized protein YjbI with pentapeptide repeats
MANPKHLELLRQGVRVWNAWRKKEPFIEPDLRKANLRGANLSGADLSTAYLNAADLREANLSKAMLSAAHIGWTNLTGSDLSMARLGHANYRGRNLIAAQLPGANLAKVNLTRADLYRTNLYSANLTKVTACSALFNEANLAEVKFTGANLREAHLVGANLSRADLSGASLNGADLGQALLIEANLTNANVTGCHVYGISAWGLKLSRGTKQHNLVITKMEECEVTADDIEVAQFLYLMLHNASVRRIIDTVTSKVVLILGRFTPRRKAVLDALRDELRKRGRSYAPVVFDFEKPRSQTRVETVTLLARMARFVIADLTDAKSVLQELQAIVPNSPMLPVQPIIIAAQQEPGMFDFIESFPSVLKTHRYDNLKRLIADLDERVIRPAEVKVLELRGSH